MNAGLLKPVLQALKPEDAEVFVLYPSRQHLSVQVKAFLAFVNERLDQISDWINSPFESLDAPVAGSAR